jgi:hypothetical protein
LRADRGAYDSGECLLTRCRLAAVDVLDPVGHGVGVAGDVPAPFSA